MSQPPLSFRDNQLKPFSVWKYYETEKEAVSELKSHVVARFGKEDPSSKSSPYLGMTLSEIDDHFKAVLEEVDHQACLSLIAAAEAAIWVDFRRRVMDRKKDPISKSFRLLRQEKRNVRKIRFDDEILQTWVSQDPGCKRPIGNFRGALKYRHWLAHGRYWQTGASYYPPAVMQIIGEMFAKMHIAL
jgi:hypothetical protein